MRRSVKVRRMPQTRDRPCPRGQLEQVPPLCPDPEHTPAIDVACAKPELHPGDLNAFQPITRVDGQYRDSGLHNPPFYLTTCGFIPRCFDHGFKQYTAVETCTRGNGPGVAGCRPSLATPLQVDCRAVIAPQRVRSMDTAPVMSTYGKHRETDKASHSSN